MFSIRGSKIFEQSVGRISICREKAGSKESTSGEKTGRTKNKAEKLSQQGPSAVLVQNCGTGCPTPLRPLRILNNSKTNLKPIFLKRNTTAKICF